MNPRKDQPIRATDIARAIGAGLRAFDKLTKVIHGRTTTGSEVIHVVTTDGQAFNITVTKARVVKDE